MLRSAGAPPPWDGEWLTHKNKTPSPRVTAPNLVVLRQMVNALGKPINWGSAGASPPCGCSVADRPEICSSSRVILP